MMRTPSSLSNNLRRWSRAAALVSVLGGAGAMSACDDFLAAENPGAIPAERLSDTALVDLMHNSTIAGLQGGTGFWYNWLGATFTDELVNLHVYFEEGLWDQRRVSTSHSYNSAFLYAPIMRARWLADSVAGRMRAVYPDSATHDVRLARVYANAGYNLIRLAEGFCEAPIPTGGQTYAAPSPSEDVFRMAEARFDSAIKVADAARAANEAASGALADRWVLGADSVRNLAYVGKARALLGRNSLSAAAMAARQVTGMGASNDFTYWLYYNSNTTLGLSNTFEERLSGGGGATSGTINYTPFIGLDDPRVPHPIDETTGAPLPEPAMSGSYVVPNSPPSFSTFDGSEQGADFTYGAAMRLASLLEAKYIIAEAEGPTAENIAFIESRRLAYPSTTALTPTTASNYMQNLIDQRRRDFYLDGHRMGDLRRYDKYYGIDLWPKGTYPFGTNVTYGTQKCWPLITSEVTNNPLVPKPYNPPTGP